MIIELLSRASVFNIPTIIDGPAHNMFSKKIMNPNKLVRVQRSMHDL